MFLAKNSTKKIIHLVLSRHLFSRGSSKAGVIARQYLQGTLQDNMRLDVEKNIRRALILISYRASLR